MSHSVSGEIGSGSGDISVPTDMTVTSEADSEEPVLGYHKKLSQEIHSLTAEKNQLRRVIEKLRLELQGRDAQLLASKSRCENLLSQKETQYEMKISEKQIIINRLQTEIKLIREESHLLKEKAAKELAHLMEKCLQFQQNQQRFLIRQDEVKATLDNIHVAESEYERLKSLSPQQLNLQQIASLRVYELTVPLSLKVKELTSVNSSLETSLQATERQLEHTKSHNANMEREVSLLQGKLVDAVTQVEELRKEFQRDDYRIHNYERVKRERDKLEEERETAQRQRAEFELSSSVYKRENEVLHQRVSGIKNQLRHWECEATRYQSEFRDTSNHLEKVKEDALKNYSVLKCERERSEEFQEKFLKSKTEIISLSEQLKDSQHKLNILNGKLSLTTTSEKEFKEKFNNISISYERILHDSESLQSRYLKERDIYKEEMGELKSKYDSLAKNYNILLENNSKSSYEASEWAVKERRLEGQVDNLTQKLEVYRKLEEDYLGTLRMFAHVSDKKMLPASSIVAGKLSEETLSLTRQILRLERKNVESCSTIQKLISSLDHLRNLLSSYKASISAAGKPSTHLLEQISTQQQQIIALQTALDSCDETKNELTKKLERMTADLDSVSTFQEEGDHIKSQISSIRSELDTLLTYFTPKSKQGWSSKKENLPTAIKITKKIQT